MKRLICLEETAHELQVVSACWGKANFIQFLPARVLPLYKQLLVGMKEVIPHQAGGTKWDTKPGFLCATNKEALSVSRGHQSAVK